MSATSDVREDIYYNSTEADPSFAEDRYTTIGTIDGGIELSALELRTRDLEAEIDASANADMAAREAQLARLRKLKARPLHSTRVRGATSRSRSKWRRSCRHAARTTALARISALAMPPSSPLAAWDVPGSVTFAGESLKPNFPRGWPETT